MILGEMERVKEAEKGDRSEEDQACQDLLPGTVTAEKKMSPQTHFGVLERDTMSSKHESTLVRKLT